MAYHWARMIELLHSVEKIDELLHDPDLQGTDLVATGTRRERGRRPSSRRRAGPSSTTTGWTRTTR